MASRTSAIYTIAGVTALGGLVAYAVWFDHKRRNDLEFRKQLKKDKKRAEKRAAAAQKKSATGPDDADLQAAVLEIKKEISSLPQELHQQYFTQQIAIGEQMAAQGPMFRMQAALALFKALCVFPRPQELIPGLQEVLPKEVFEIVLELLSVELSMRIEGYFKAFPPAGMNVSIKTAPGGENKLRNILVAGKDFEAGDLIYKERPLVAVLDLDLEGQGRYCSHCLRRIEDGSAIRPENDRLNSVYCSEDCRARAQAESQNLLFGLKPVLPEEVDSGLSELIREPRDEAQKKFVEHLKSEGRTVPLLVARFVSKQVAIETAKQFAKGKIPLIEQMTAEAMSDKDYSLYDHMERLRFIDGEASEEEMKLLSAVLGSALPGLENLLTSERYATYKGKMRYNTIGISYDGGRDDKPTSTFRPEDQERTRTPSGTSRQIGSGLFLVSSYMTHSCDSNARPSFESGNSELSLTAVRPIKKGEEITMSYIDVSQHPDETPEEARRRRRFELARGWRFKCECERCKAEANGGNDNEVDVEKDESKVEDFVARVLGGAHAEDGPA